MASEVVYRFEEEPQHRDGSFDQRTPSNRRIHERRKANQLEWLRAASVKYGAEARIVDISAGGVLLETQQALKPNSSVILELAGPDSRILVPSQVIRCRVASLSRILTYEGACAFKQPVTIPELAATPTSEKTESSMSVQPTTDTSVRRKVVARFNDGRIVHGYTNDFDPSEDQLRVSFDLQESESTIIPLSELKAVFFVRDFSGDPMSVDANFFSETPDGDRMELMLCEDEVMAGSTQRYQVDDPAGFFLQPTDPQSNNLSVFVTAAGVQHVQLLSPKRQHTDRAPQRRGFNRKAGLRRTNR